MSNPPLSVFPQYNLGMSTACCNPGQPGSCLFNDTVVTKGCGQMQRQKIHLFYNNFYNIFSLVAEKFEFFPCRSGHACAGKRMQMCNMYMHKHKILTLAKYSLCRVIKECCFVAAGG